MTNFGPASDIIKPQPRSEEYWIHLLGFNLIKPHQTHIKCDRQLRNVRLIRHIVRKTPQLLTSGSMLHVFLIFAWPSRATAFWSIHVLRSCLVRLISVIQYQSSSTRRSKSRGTALYDLHLLVNILHDVHLNFKIP